MSTSDPNEAMREAVRDALRELLPDVVGGPAATNGHAPSDRDGDPHPARRPGHEAEVVPLVPAPPVAAVLRPSTWRGPVVAGEVIGADSPGARSARSARSAPAPPTGATFHAAPAPRRPADVRPASEPTPADATVETVTIDGDEDLQAFVRSLVTRLESPRDRLAIKAGRLRFALRRSAAPVGATAPDGPPAVHVGRGAVTERHVREAHAQGTRLVLARAAVLTPLARETARTLGVQIERETQC